MGAEALRGMAGRIEEAGRHGDLAAMRERLPLLRAQHARLEEAFEK